MRALVMNQAIVRASVTLAMLPLLAAAPLRAQRAVTVTGHVTSRGAPLAGAHVRVDALRIDRTTDPDGRYSFVVPSGSVHGQQVKVVATMSDRRLRYVPSTATITLTGVPITQDFDLALATGNETVVAHVDSSAPSPAASRPVATQTRDVIEVEPATAVGGVASALVGRVPGLRAAPASTPGGSSQLVFRGPRSALGSNQPLYVVDGVPMTSTVFASAAQRFGLGGFDYGSPIDDIDPANIESVQFMSAAEAAAAYGGRGANGVVMITTKSAVVGPHLAVGATHVTTGGTHVRLPTLQNSYGQGLNGTFSFFDGKGGGLNDAVDQNWGPALDGRPLPQASYLEAGRGDVRLWVRNPDNVQGYFVNGTSSNTTASVQARNDIASFRATLGDRGAAGLTPRDHVGRRDAAVQATFQPNSRFQVALGALGVETKINNAPGTGVGAGNPVFQFLQMGRQVNLDSLEKHLRDATGKQLSWNYAGHNNPFFEALACNNYSHRYHTAGTGSATYALSSSLTATARGGVDYYRDGRLFTVPSGWMGGFPYFAGSGDFSRGGSEGDEIFVQQSSAAVRLDNKRTLSSGTTWTLGGGVDMQSTRQRIHSAGVDSAANVPFAGAPDTARIPQPQDWSAHATNNSVFGETGFAFTNGASVRATVRNAWVATGPNQTATVLLPAVRATYNLARGAKDGPLTSAVLRGGWWRDTPESSPYSIETLYAGRTPTGALAPVGNALLLPSSTLSPEVTNGFEVGTDFGFRRFGLALGLAYYHEQTSDLVLPVATSTGAYVGANVGSITNQGVDARLTAQLGEADANFGWTVSANASKNSNQVDALAGGQSSLLLGPTRWGLSVEARPGQPLGVLRGLRLLRDASGALLLKNGLPVGDSAAGPQQLGVGQPSWSFGLGNTVRYRWFSLSAQADARVGGQVFSATNMIGTYSGTLATTSFRPDTGLVIAGLDAATHSANTKHVLAQDYYHALGSIAEPWIYSATFVKLREARLSATLPSLKSLPFETVRASLVGRNLWLWAKAPNVDPELVFSPYQLPGVEMGQLPAIKSFGIEITVVP